MKEELVVRRISDGTVIDHIPAGRALRVLKLLGITGERDGVVALVMNVPSKKLGKKDIVKIEGRELSKEEVDKISLIAPSATINIIRNFEVASKRRVELPRRVVGILRCLNPNCVTNAPREAVEPSFTLISESPLRMVCEYCGEYLREEDIIEQLSGV
ncbi:aspartate carbamoyltransferase regulatory subunit [Candidatus Korarchaeum cryptofilum]|jgi:aspartate carbamoyltransferase regulatory subunit|uniref:Aspartate carbamoyltransferase regulatory chain n=2 Tax=Candidatus Korarchaeum cryptofilum TaxID=498846 RepID=PYRI_KORCO|nr:aspartate carbamoyltransferase regulatory subunit [Candidatus Korarchaeum cryptofilum]B1L384.1 RecName: Full=Aspartate carbamoyltransferase regulatory chain [Candidatus Korarchaeum cryptofilum OPF8]ACB06913.1 aspartate carbamoyltransferase, regulatory subunit [Candidatus Korarchaeum cryptofilum OPF8]RSN67175.1 aspartate carbamoyltransferase regulatory subunit [Candidatus Korarchaeum cryptofilum]